jgi:hypothetical protein
MYLLYLCPPNLVPTVDTNRGREGRRGQRFYSTIIRLKREVEDRMEDRMENRVEDRMEDRVEDRMEDRKEDGRIG